MIDNANDTADLFTRTLQDAEQKTFNILPSSDRNSAAIGGFLVCLDVPTGTEFGMDYEVFRTGPKFQGIKFLPLGVHFVIFRSREQEHGIRQGFFINVERHGQFIVREWSKEKEELGLPRPSLNVEALEILSFQLDGGLGPYPKQHLKTWQRLSSFISASVLQHCGVEFDAILLPGDAFEDASSSDNQNGIIPYFSDLPRTVRFTKLQKQRADLSAAAKTMYYFDRRLEELIETQFGGDWKQLIGELQLSFLIFLQLSSLAALEQWKQIPEDFFHNETTGENFLSPCLLSLLELIEDDDAPPKLRQKAFDLRRLLTDRFQWETRAEMEMDEFAPVVVSEEEISREKSFNTCIKYVVPHHFSTSRCSCALTLSLLRQGESFEPIQKIEGILALDGIPPLAEEATVLTADCRTHVVTRTTILVSAEKVMQHAKQSGLIYLRNFISTSEYRPKGTQQHDTATHPHLAPPGADGMDVNAPVFKHGGGSYNLQHTARPFNGPMGYGPAVPMGSQSGIPQQMRGNPHHHQQRIRGPPRGTVHQHQQPQQQQFVPRGSMNAGAPGYYPPQMQMPPPFMVGGPAQHYMGAPAIYGMPIQDMGIGMEGIPINLPLPQPHPQPLPKRENKRLAIVDPKTGKAIDFGRNASSGRSGDANTDDTKPVAVSTSSTPQNTPHKKELTLKVDIAPAPVDSIAPEANHTGATGSVTESPKQHQNEEIASKILATTESTLAVEPHGVNGTSIPDDTVESATKEKNKSVDKIAVEPDSNCETSESTTLTTDEILSPEPTAQDSEETFGATQPKSISPKKKMPGMDGVAPALPQKTLVMENDGEVQGDVSQKTSAVEETPDSNGTLQKKAGVKLIYSLEILRSFRERFKDLPAHLDSDSCWPSMEITSEVAVSRSSSRGVRSGGGWERGDKQSGGIGRQGSRSGSGGQWARSQDLSKRSGRGERGGRAGRGGRGGPPDPPLLDGPVKPLTRSANRWIPTKNSSTLEVTKKNVNSIMNKMTREKFERLAGQLTSINMESLEMLQAVIKIIFDKAVSEPHFCDMYADLCVHLETHWKVWSFLKIVQNDDDKSFYWTAMSNSDSEVVGPFDTVTSALESARSEEFEPVPAPSNIKLHEVRIQNHKFVKVWMKEDGTKRQCYWSGQDLDDLGDDQVLNGPYESHEVASRVALKTCSFKRILLNACQEEFEKDNIYEELEQKFKQDKEDGKITQQMEADYEEKRLIMKLRMLGNIRFIGELYRKGMLQERIMHECIMKLMDVRLNSDSVLVCVHPNSPPDEESIESLAKLLTTMGKDLDKHGAEGFMSLYFNYLEKNLVKDKRLSSRITFMIKDVIELRQHRWEPRRKELKQKTLTEIRKEAEREARAPPNSVPGGRDFSRSDRRANSSRDGFSSSRSTMAPVYQHSQSLSSRGNSNKQVTLPRTGVRDDSVKTGPSGRPALFGNPRQGGRGGLTGSPAKTLSSSRRVSGTKKSQSPAHAKVIPPLDEESLEKIGKKAKSIADEYASIVDLKEADICFIEVQKEYNNHEDVDGVFAYEILKEAIDAKAEVREKMLELLEKLSLETKSLGLVGIRYAIGKLLEACGDLWCDVPKLQEHMADFIIRFMKDSSVTGVSLDWLLGTCLRSMDKDAVEELIDGGFLAAVVGEVLKLLKVEGVKKAQNEIRATNIAVMSIFPSNMQSSKDMQKWIKKYELDDVFLLDRAFDIVDRVLNASSRGEVTHYLETSFPSELLFDSFFAAHTCLFILSLSEENELPSSERCLLLTGFCGSVETQIRLISAIIQTRQDHGSYFLFIGSRDEWDALIGSVFALDEMKRLLKHLVKESAVTAHAFNKWLEQQNDNSVSRKRVQEELSRFGDELARIQVIL
ncbi:hypothetical protein PsorP6_014734 [Peronosclerospora sorghi]|uniref:Uncharacterized protein n=1 Tax=Peronosclerospora sorghi TaxID=230839 RepID=A0ACC0VST5_9STRA|nr:hypothetical protein PsorP6_014734 [Peronosclerospora sorghi]